MNAGTVTGWKWEVPDEAGYDDAFPLEQAIAELVDGKLTVKDEDLTYQYGYASENVARAIGQHLATIEGDIMLTGLKLKTPLSRRRKPVKLPRSDDVPEIGYLTAEEVQEEHSRLQGRRTLSQRLTSTRLRFAQSPGWATGKSPRISGAQRHLLCVRHADHPVP